MLVANLEHEKCRSCKRSDIFEVMARPKRVESVFCASYVPDIHEESSAGIARLDPPISANLLALKLVAKLAKAQVDSGHLADCA